MAFHRSANSVKAVVLAVSLSLYFCALIFGLQLWSYILSPIGALLAGGIIAGVYKKLGKAGDIGISLLLYAAGCLLWGIADILWVVWEISGMAPESSLIIQSAYAITNFCFLFAVIIFAGRQFSKWNFVQAAIDSAILLLLSLTVLWIACLDKDISKLYDMMQFDYTGAFLIATDILIFFVVIFLQISIRSGKVPTYMRVLLFGTIAFVFFDLHYYHCFYNQIYVPNSLMDFGYILSFAIIALGALMKTNSVSAAENMPSFSNVGNNSKWLWLLFYPLGLILLDLAGGIKAQLNFIDISACLILIAFHTLVSRFIQLSVQNEKLLLNEKINNEILERRIAEQVRELMLLSRQDTLTALFNRRYFLESLEEETSSILTGEQLILFLLDMDRFKTINDTYGHDMGDQVLVELSRRMIAWNNYGATIARLGGDEFAVMLIGNYSQRDIQELCKEIITVCSSPITIDENRIFVTISLGVALYSQEACDAKTLMKNADIAMYRAKSQGYNKYQIYNPILSQDINNSNRIEVLLRRDGVEKEFEMFYQPQFSLPDMELVGAEALLRWKSREYGYIPPNLFIHVAEEIDYVNKIGKWVMVEAVSQAAIWNKNSFRSVKIGFNISPKQLEDESFFGEAKAVFLEHGVDSAWLDAEITESIMINDGEKVDSTLGQLKELGISISIDDFGSGYSGLGYLTRYPFDRLKIDKTLIDNVSCYNVSGTNIVKAAITMAKSAGITTIAEGVETQEQLDILMELGCDQVQGYLLGRPVPADIFEMRFLTNDGNTRPID